MWMVLALVLGCGMPEYEACELSAQAFCDCEDECEALENVEGACEQYSAETAATDDVDCLWREYSKTCDYEGAEDTCL